MMTSMSSHKKSPILGDSLSAWCLVLGAWCLVLLQGRSNEIPFPNGSLVRRRQDRCSRQLIINLLHLHPPQDLVVTDDLKLLPKRQPVALPQVHDHEVIFAVDHHHLPLRPCPDRRGGGSGIRHEDLLQLNRRLAL